MFSLCASRHLALFSLCAFSLWPLVIGADTCVAEKVDVGNAIIKLMSAAVQATVMGSLGPFVLYFGRDIENIVCVVQAALIADFAKLSYQFEGFCPAKLSIIAKSFLNVGMSTAGIAFGMIKDDGFRATAQGISLGMIAMTPAMGSISKPILEATGQFTCKATPDFPGGAPCAQQLKLPNITVKVSQAPDLCELPDLKIDAMFSLWFVSGLPTLVAICMGKVAKTKLPEKLEVSLEDLPGAMPEIKVPWWARLVPCLNCCVGRYEACQKKYIKVLGIIAEYIKDLAFAFTGSFMVLKAFLDIGVPIWQVADPCGAEEALPAINGSTTALTYALGGASFLWQRVRKSGGKQPSGFIVKINDFIGKCAKGNVQAAVTEAAASATASVEAAAAKKVGGAVEGAGGDKAKKKDGKMSQYISDAEEEDKKTLRASADPSPQKSTPPGYVNTEPS